MVGKSDLVALLLYSLPLFLQFFKKGLVRIYGLWFGIFLVLQTLASLFVLQSDYHTMKPGMHKISDGKTIGIEGKQLLITDEHGYRTTKKVDYGKKQAENIRIFAIGASTTAQAFIDNRKTWTGLLQDKLEERFAPIIVTFVLLGGLIVLAQGSAIAPFIYTLF